MNEEEARRLLEMRDVVVDHRADGSMAVTVVIPPGKIQHAVYDCRFGCDSVLIEPNDKRKPMILVNASFRTRR